MQARKTTVKKTAVKKPRKSVKQPEVVVNKVDDLRRSIYNLLPEEKEELFASMQLLKSVDGNDNTLASYTLQQIAVAFGEYEKQAKSLILKLMHINRSLRNVIGFVRQLNTSVEYYSLKARYLQDEVTRKNVYIDDGIQRELHLIKRVRDLELKTGTHE